MARRWSVAATVLLAAVMLLVAGPGHGSAWALITPPNPIPPPGPVPALPLLSPPPPDQDPFYRQPDSLGSHRPGSVLRSRPVTILGLTSPTSVRAYQLLFRTNDATGHPIAAVNTVLLPTVPAPGPRKLVSYHPAQDSLTTRCAPSYTLRTHSGSTQLTESGGIASLLAQGLVVVVPDYEGPRSEFAVGPLEGRVALDSIRAAQHFGPAGLDGQRTEVGMMGYSGGSIPSVWANALAPDYAPELRIVGSAAGGTVVDPAAVISFTQDTPYAVAVLAAFGIGIDRAYPDLDLDSLLNARGRELAAQVGRDAYGCALGAIVSAPLGKFSEFTHYPNAEALLAVPRVESILAKLNLIEGPTPRSPSFFFHEINDEAVPIAPVDRLVAANCSDGATITYRRADGGEHAVGAVQFVPEAVLYLRQRFDGGSAPNTCPVRD